MTIRLLALPFAFFALGPAQSHAVTVTFDPGAGAFYDMDNDGYDDLYIENGVSLTGFWIELSDSPGKAHLDNPGDGHYADKLYFTYGRHFHLRNLEIWGGSFDCPDEVGGCAGQTFENIVLSGYRDGALVWRDQFAMPPGPIVYRGPGANMRPLDLFVVQALDGPGIFEFGNQHFSIDNIVLAPVPLPAGIALLGGALAALGLIRRRRNYA